MNLQVAARRSSRNVGYNSCSFGNSSSSGSNNSSNSSSVSNFDCSSSNSSSSSSSSSVSNFDCSSSNSSCSSSNSSNVGCSSNNSSSSSSNSNSSSSSSSDDSSSSSTDKEPTSTIERDSTALLTRQELLDMFVSFTGWTKNTYAGRKDPRLVVGMVGYPNVGKSSTINVLVAEKKVTVGTTPGKTKHFQTLNLSEDLMLCDCPGLVFPTFMQSASSLVCNGILPIDQMKDFLGPVRELCRRISKSQFFAVYGINFPDWKQVTPLELLEAHAKIRSFTKDHGRYDEHRSARVMLKDVVNGKLLYCHPPPGLSDTERAEFASSLVFDDIDEETKRTPEVETVPEGSEDEDEDVPIEELSENLKNMTPLEMIAPHRKKIDVVNPVNDNLDPNMLGLTSTEQPKKLTKKQQRRQNKNNINKRTKQRNKDIDPYGVGHHTVNPTGELLAGVYKNKN